MKALVAILVLLLAVETYGVYGRAQADRLVAHCTLQAGPLCFAWKENALGKLLGPAPSKEVEEKLVVAKKAWEEAFEDKIAKRLETREGIDDLVTDARKKAKEALDSVGKGVEKLTDKATDPAIAQKARDTFEALGESAGTIIEKTQEALDGSKTIVELEKTPATAPRPDAGAKDATEADKRIKDGKAIELD